jgi:hypothetical protein
MAAGIARCGLSGKIECQCNHNTFSPGADHNDRTRFGGEPGLLFHHAEHYKCGPGATKPEIETRASVDPKYRRGH